MNAPPGEPMELPPPGSLAARWPRWMAAILVAGVVVRIAVRLDLVANHPMWGVPALDSRVYLEWAARIAGGSWGLDRPFFLNPLYAYFLAPLAAVFDAALPEAVRVVQAVMGLGTAWLVGTAARRWFGPLPGLVAAACAAFSPVLLFYETEPMIVTLAVLLNAGALALLAGAGPRPSIGRLAGIGLVLGCAVLARPNVALFLAAILAWWPLRLPAGERVRGFLRTAVITGGCAVLPVLPAWFHNASRGDPAAVVTTSAGINLWLCNNPRAWRTGEMGADEARFHPRLLELDAQAYAEGEAGRPLKPSEVSQWWAAHARSAMAEEPGTAARFLLRKGLYYVHPFHAPSSHHFEALREDTVVLRWLPFGLALIAPLTIAGLVVAARRRETWPPLLLWATYGAGLVIFYPLAHYRAPALPGWFVLAGAAAGAGVAAWRSGVPAVRWKAAAVLLAGVFVTRAADGFALAGVPSLAPCPDRRTLYEYNTGLGMLERAERARGEGRTAAAETAAARAEARFQRALDIAGTTEPARDLPPMGLAMVAAFRGDRAAEERWLREAERLNPNDAYRTAWLGSVLLAGGDRRGADGRAVRAAGLPANDIESRIAIGTLFYELGRIPDAGRWFAAAYDLAPDRDDLLANKTLCLRRMGRWNDAWNLLEDGIREHPGSGLLRIERARVLVGTGQAEPAAVRAELRAAVARGAVVPPDLEPWMR